MKSLSSSFIASKPKPPGQAGFAKVVAGGQVIRPDAQLPFYRENDYWHSYP